MPPASRALHSTTCPAHGSGLISPAAPLQIQVATLTATRLADYAICTLPQDVIFEGKTMVLAGGLPMSGVGDATAHKGVISTGEASVLIGGPTFSLPPNITIDGSDTYRNKVIRDLYLLSTTPNGRALIDRLGAAGEAITIKEYSGTNGYCTPTNPIAAFLGISTGSVIDYNPDYRSNAYDASGALIAQPPQVILGHEMAHALANSEGNHKYSTDPSPPASETTIEEEEAQAIGTGSHGADPDPNENGIRSDLGLGRRDNHYGTGGPTAGEPPPVDLRPGGY